MVVGWLVVAEGTADFGQLLSVFLLGVCAVEEPHVRDYISVSVHSHCVCARNAFLKWEGDKILASNNIKQ